MLDPSVFDPAHTGCLETYTAQFATDFPQAKTAGWAAVYLQGLLLDCDRKSIESLARQVVVPPGLPDTDPKQTLQHFISHSPWDEERVWQRYRQLMGSAFASTRGCWVINTIGIKKSGRNSVGVHRQPCGPAAQKANCQVAVALHYVSPAGHFPVGLHLYLPAAWLEDVSRLEQAGVPASERRLRTKADIALGLLDQVRSEGLPGCAVVTGEGFGASAPVRAALAARGLHHVAAVAPDALVFPHAPSWHLTAPPHGAHAPRGPRLSHGTKPPVRVADLAPPEFSGAPDRRPTVAGRAEPATWRTVWPGQGWESGECANAPPLQLLTQKFADGRPPRFAFTDPRPDLGPDETLQLLNCRDVMDADYRTITETLGLAHFEGRSWRGFHHHACMVTVAFGFLALHQLGCSINSTLSERLVRDLRKA